MAAPSNENTLDSTATTSVLDTLYHATSERGLVSSDATKEAFAQLFTLTGQMAPQMADDIFHAVCNICNIYEYICFTEGVKVGFRLSKELTA